MVNVTVSVGPIDEGAAADVHTFAIRVEHAGTPLDADVLVAIALITFAQFAFKSGINPLIALMEHVDLWGDDVVVQAMAKARLIGDSLFN